MRTQSFLTGLAIFIVAGLGLADPKPSPYAEVRLEGPHIFRITPETDELEIKDGRIRRITLGKDGKALTILFDNTGAEPYRPLLKIVVLDQFGLPMKSCLEAWVFTSVGPGETRSHDAIFLPEDMPDLLKYTTAPVPETTRVPTWFVIEYQD